MAKFRKLLRAKIHRATVTHADLHYEGSLSIPLHLMQAADIKQYEAVNIWNVTSGTRLETYAIEGSSGSNFISANGAAAHHIRPGDIIIIACFTDVEESEVRDHKPKLVFVDENNSLLPSRQEVPGPNGSSN